YSEQREEVGGHAGAEHALRLTLAGTGPGSAGLAAAADDEPPGSVRGDPLERAAELSPIDEVGGGAARAGGVLPGIRLRERDQPIRIAIRQRPTQHAVDGSEQCGRRANAEAEHGNGDGGEAAGASENTDAVPHVLP